MNWASLVGDWDRVLIPIFRTQYFSNLMKYLKINYETQQVYPEKSDIFKAFKLCPYYKLKVVILGQDPYFTNGRATGLAFANPESSTTLSPSLYKIRDAVEQDIYNGMALDFDPTLEKWAKQGILLLNTALTVRYSEPESHLGIWHPFTKYVLKHLSSNYGGLVYFIWGKKAANNLEFISKNGNFVYQYEHPAYAVRNGRPWECDHFHRATQVIRTYHDEELIW